MIAELRRPSHGADSTDPARRRKAPKILVGLATVFSIAGTGYWTLTQGRETTDDAFVEGHVANVAARIQAQVAEVLVKDNQVVDAGAVLVRLDPRDIEVRLQAARADEQAAKAALALAETNLNLVQRNVAASLRQARGGVLQAQSLTTSSIASIDQAKAAEASAESRLDLARLEWRRASQLVAEGALSQAALDDKNAQRVQAEAALAESQARREMLAAGVQNATGGVESANARLLLAQSGPTQIEAARAEIGVARARVQQSEAAVAQAELNLSYTTVRAAFRGIISRRTVEPGQMVDPSRPLLSLTSLDELWIVANYKEDQITRMHGGQPVKISVDAFPGERLLGRVDSLAGATGARFSLLPPDNASGNFTKVVQRVPVLIRVETLPKGVVLRPGLSTTVAVDVR